MTCFRQALRRREERSVKGKEGAKQQNWKGKSRSFISVFPRSSLPWGSLTQKNTSVPVGLRTFSACNSHRFYSGVHRRFHHLRLHPWGERSNVRPLILQFRRGGSSSIPTPVLPHPTPPHTSQCYMCSNQRTPKCAPLGGFRARVGTPELYLPALTLFLICSTKVNSEGAWRNAFFKKILPLICRQTCLHTVQQI